MMCLGIPMKIIAMDGEECVVASDGLKKKANVSFLKGAKRGDYVLVHAGFAIEKVKEAEALKTLKALRALG